MRHRVGRHRLAAGWLDLANEENPFPFSLLTRRHRSFSSLSAQLPGSSTLSLARLRCLLRRDWARGGTVDRRSSRPAIAPRPLSLLQIRVLQDFNAGELVAAGMAPSSPSLRPEAKESEQVVAEKIPATRTCAVQTRQRAGGALLPAADPSTRGRSLCAGVDGRVSQIDREDGRPPRGGWPTRGAVGSVAQRGAGAEAR